MKKIIACLLALVIALSLIACGANSRESAVRDALQGSWSATWSAYGASISRYYRFKGDRYTTGGTTALGELDPESGVFKILDSEIQFIDDNDSDDSFCLSYSYNEKTGEITLWWNDDVQFRKGTVNAIYK